MTVDLTYQFVAGMTVALECAWLRQYLNALFFPKVDVLHAPTTQGSISCWCLAQF